MIPSLLTRIGKSVARQLSPAERDFRRIWPQIDAVEGFLVPGQESWLFRTARALPEGSNIVEIGSFKGRSTCCLAFGCRGTRKHVFAIDTFKNFDLGFPGQDFFSVWSRNIERCGLSPYVSSLRGPSSEIAKAWDKPIQFLFIDGSHDYEDVLADFEGFFPHVAAGGIVALHDLVETWPGPLRAWNESIKHQLTGIGYCSTLGYGRKSVGGKRRIGAHS